MSAPDRKTANQSATVYSYLFYKSRKRDRLTTVCWAAK